MDVVRGDFASFTKYVGGNVGGFAPLKIEGIEAS